MPALGVRVRDSRLNVMAMRDLVRLAEDNGYDSVWLPESMGREALTELTALVPIGEPVQETFQRTIAGCA